MEMLVVVIAVLWAVTLFLLGVLAVAAANLRQQVGETLVLAEQTLVAVRATQAAAEAIRGAAARIQGAVAEMEAIREAAEVMLIKATATTQERMTPTTPAKDPSDETDPTP